MHDAVPDTLHAGPLRLRVGSRVASGRLHVLERLGRGGMGVVYRAYDDVRRTQVAVKTVNRVDPLAIYALKNEFRSLADVHHPNLVRLFELFCEGDDWFFTMELVPGERFDRWVRPNGELDGTRLRRAYAQLLDGIEAVHDCGKLHRDIKSSNVLVTDDGHVVVLDFGLVTEGQAHSIGETVTDGGIAGTPAYLAPEQFLGAPATVASDLYALGVMLFEALTGRLPFQGSNVELLAAKQRAPADASVNGAPADLVQLCLRLLACDVASRPSLSELRSHFTAERESGVRMPPFRSTPPLPAAELIGRERELAQLRAAFLASREGRPVVVSVAGDSGIGKSALCNAFLDEIVQEGSAVVLRGRCNERESVPFKALDSLVDSLSRYLRRMRSEHVASLLPRDAAALTTLFPVLARVDAFAEAPARPATDPHDQLRRAFAAFHELLGRICDRGPLVLYIDDLQWTDRDSTQLLCYMLRRADQLAGLFVFSHRGEACGDSELAEVAAAAEANRQIELHRIELAPLQLSAAVQLARRWLPATGEAAASDLAVRIEQEARGNPFLIGEFSRYVASSGELEPTELTLRGALDARLSSLSEPARKLLAVLALAGKPLASDLLLAISGTNYEAIDTLQSEHLVRSGRERGARRLEPYHDRIRERLCEAIAPEEARALYRELARACADRADVDADTRCAYLEGAGDVAGAASCAAAAADQSAGALAFDHAARLYGKALELGVYSPPQALRLTKNLASSLANAGRSVEAAGAYQRAALLAGGDDSLDLRRHAAEQLLAAGHAGEGLSLLESLCDEVELELPKHGELGRARFAFALGKLRLTAPLVRFGERPIERRRALRLDVLQTAIVGMQCYAHSGASQLALEYLNEALRAGDARHAVWALGSLAMLKSLRSFGPQLVAHMEDIATRDGRKELRGLVYGLRGWLASRQAHYREARDWFAKAQAVYAECVGMQWQIDLIHIFDQSSASMLGDYVEVMRTTPALIEDAFRCGRVWTGTMLTGYWAMPAWLAQDDAAGYRRQLARARAQWTAHGKLLLLDRASYGLYRAEVTLSVYEGEPLAGLALLSRAGAALSIPAHRRDHALLRSFCSAAALGAARRGQLRGADRAELRAQARSTPELRHAAATRPFAHVFDAAVALDDARPELAERELGSAAEHFEASGMPIFACAARRRRGQLIGGEAGRALVVRADATLASQQVRNLEAMTELLCPGCATQPH